MKNYTVCLLFTEDLAQLLLVKKTKTCYKGRLNGLGGKIKEGETAKQCVIRKVADESGVADLGNLTWLGKIVLPDCYEDAGKCCCVHFFAATFDGRLEAGYETKFAEPLGLYLVKDLLGPMQGELAGDGDLVYFIRRALGSRSELAEFIRRRSALLAKKSPRPS